MEKIIGLAVLVGIGYVLFRIVRALFRTWKISVPVIIGVCILGMLVSKGVIHTDDVSGFMGMAVLVALCVLAWACHARCPHCKTFTIKKVGERHLSTSGVYQQKCGDGHYHPHQKIIGENVYRCEKCGFEKTSRWTKTERLDT